MKILASLREWYEEDRRQALTFGIAALAAAAESRSEHPLGRAIAAACPTCWLCRAA